MATRELEQRRSTSGLGSSRAAPSPARYPRAAQARWARPPLPSPGPFLLPAVLPGAGRAMASPAPCPVPISGCRDVQGWRVMEAGGSRGGGGPCSPPACCGWSRGVEVTRGDTAAQTATSRTIVASAEDAGGHAAPNARQGAGHIPGTPRKGTRPGGVTPWGLRVSEVALGRSWAIALGSGPRRHSLGPGR